MALASSAIPDRLYHYTTAAGLKGICDSGSVWMTDAEFLNDAQELHFGRDALCLGLEAESERLAGKEPEYEHPKYSQALIMKSAANELRASANTPVRQSGLAVYVTCFCEEGDLLSQWRGYAAGGFAIGFNAASLANLGGPPRYAGQSFEPLADADLVKIKYGEDAIQPTVARVVTVIAPEGAGHPNNTGWVRANTIAKPALASIKHNAFAEEKEWRLISAGTGEQKVHFRAGSFGLIPYRLLPFDRAAIEEVVVGPGSHSDLRALGVQRFLASNGIPNAIARPSTAPYRA